MRQIQSGLDAEVCSSAADASRFEAECVDGRSQNDKMEALKALGQCRRTMAHLFAIPNLPSHNPTVLDLGLSGGQVLLPNNTKPRARPEAGLEPLTAKSCRERRRCDGSGGGSPAAAQQGPGGPLGNAGKPPASFAWPRQLIQHAWGVYTCTGHSTRRDIYRWECCPLLPLRPQEQNPPILLSKGGSHTLRVCKATRRNGAGACSERVGTSEKGARNLRHCVHR